MSVALGFIQSACPSGRLLELVSEKAPSPGKPRSDQVLFRFHHQSSSGLLLARRITLPLRDSIIAGLALDDSALEGDPQEILGEINRIVSPEGVVAVTTSRGTNTAELLRRCFPFVTVFGDEDQREGGAASILVVATRRKQRFSHPPNPQEIATTPDERGQTSENRSEIDRLRGELLRSRGDELEALKRGDQLVETVAALEDELEVTLETLQVTRKHLLERRDISDELADQLADARIRIESLEDELRTLRSEHLAQSNELTVAVEEATEALRAERRTGRRLDEVGSKVGSQLRKEALLRRLLLRLAESRIAGAPPVDHDLDS